LKIAINTRLLVKDKLEGIGRFTFEILKRITINHPEHQFVFLFDRKPDEVFKFSSNVELQKISPPTRHPLLIKWWFDFSLPSVLKKIKPDVFISPDGFLPKTNTCPLIPVFHDLNFEHYPNFLPYSIARLYKKRFPVYANKSSKIITVSNFSKQDIIKTYNIEEGKIDVVYNAVSSNFNILDEEERTKVRKEFSGGKQYFVYVGSLHERKNIHSLLKAFSLFKEKSGSDMKLLLVGEKMWATAPISEGLLKDVLFLGRLNDEELARVMASAFALTYFSFYEGFGIPLIEAMNCGVPVLCSNTTSLPEVGSDACLLANPESVEEMSTVMFQIVQNDDLRNSLIEKGFRRVKDFSWDESAEKFMKTILSIKKA
jgi:glycosyltransferase involved in cell wall biosynthesis